MKTTFTRDEVISIIEIILQMPDSTMDDITGTEELLKRAEEEQEESKQIASAMESERRHPNLF